MVKKGFTPLCKTIIHVIYCTAIIWDKLVLCLMLNELVHFKVITPLHDVWNTNAIIPAFYCILIPLNVVFKINSYIDFICDCFLHGFSNTEIILILITLSYVYI